MEPQDWRLVFLPRPGLPGAHLVFHLVAPVALLVLVPETCLLGPSYEPQDPEESVPLDLSCACSSRSVGSCEHADC